MEIIAIAAMAKNRAIGKDNDLLWHLPADMRYFQQTTTGYPVLMGRKNYDSIPLKYRPLANRTNIVITRDESYNEEGAVVFHSIKDGIDFARKEGKDKLYIVGGGQIYAQTMDIISKLYLTVVDHDFDGDAFFPEFDSNDWDIAKTWKVNKDEKNKYDMQFFQYQRQQK